MDTISFENLYEYPFYIQDINETYTMADMEAIMKHNYLHHIYITSRLQQKYNRVLWKIKNGIRFKKKHNRKRLFNEKSDTIFDQFRNCSKVIVLDENNHDQCISVPPQYIELQENLIEFNNIFL
ncbi:MAG: hypothetical protein Homavirus1_2 [Homavirus sp.]|uniref:Uncharacterized protein n=1 Tax=Homavirus sp. TaxID=2487769 RepID=A0A3G5A4D0_9VIRU|nr:MAG: hypothetical protein Homavirus1_2 [Homavirus sp.]